LRNATKNFGCSVEIRMRAYYLIPAHLS
jgi:hypothetical protein